MSRETSNALEGIPDGLYMPSEWKNHDACLILYPHNQATFRLRQAQEQVLNLAISIARVGGEDVYLLCLNDEQVEQARQQLLDKESVETLKGYQNKIIFKVCPSNDTWVRDTGPTFCWDQATNKLVGLNWDFNAYGGPVEGCYWPCDLDVKVATHICEKVFSRSIQVCSIPLVLEGGSIHTDGEGTLLTTEECLLNPNRNPHLDKIEIENILKKALGIQSIIWLPQGLDADEDTNGHIDNFCCFVKPGHVVLAWTDDDERDKGNYDRCRKAYTVLSASTDAKGRTIQVHKLYLPPPIRYTQEEAQSLMGENDEEGMSIGRAIGEKMAASYVNFYISNNAIFFPTFGIQESDDRAGEKLQSLFPYHNICGVPSKEILMGGGNIHCMTQQVPGNGRKEGYV